MCIYVSQIAHVYTYINIYIYVCACVCMCVHVCVYVYIYIPFGAGQGLCEPVPKSISRSPGSAAGFKCTRGSASSLAELDTAAPSPVLAPDTSSGLVSDSQSTEVSSLPLSAASPAVARRSPEACASGAPAVGAGVCSGGNFSHDDDGEKDSKESSPPLRRRARTHSFCDAGPPCVTRDTRVAPGLAPRDRTAGAACIRPRPPVTQPPRPTHAPCASAIATISVDNRMFGCTNLTKG